MRNMVSKNVGKTTILHCHFPTFYDRHLQQVTVRVIFDLSGAGNNNPQKQDIIYRLNFKDNKITEWSEYVYAQMEPGVPLNQQ